jgi:hypothetical protein
MAVNTGIRVVSIVPVQVDSFDQTLIDIFTFPSYGVGRMVHFKVFLLVKQNGAGGFRFLFSNLGLSNQAIKKQWDGNTLAVTFGVIPNANPNLFTPTGTNRGLIEVEGSGTQNAQNTIFRFAQNTPDVAASSVLFGSWMELVAI